MSEGRSLFLETDKRKNEKFWERREMIRRIKKISFILFSLCFLGGDDIKLAEFPTAARFITEKLSLDELIQMSRISLIIAQFCVNSPSFSS